MEGSELEQAMIFLNRIDIILAEQGESGLEDERIDLWLHAAAELLDSESLPRDPYYSFMADKCVGIYDYFGWFRYAETLRERIREIDERA